MIHERKWRDAAHDIPLVFYSSYFVSFVRSFSSSSVGFLLGVRSVGGLSLGDSVFNTPHTRRTSRHYMRCSSGKAAPSLLVSWSLVHKSLRQRQVKQKSRPHRYPSSPQVLFVPPGVLMMLLGLTMSVGRLFMGV